MALKLLTFVKKKITQGTINMHLSQNHAQAILDVFAIAISDLVSMGLTEQDAISGLLGQASVRADHPTMQLALELHKLYHKDFSKAKI